MIKEVSISVNPDEENNLSLIKKTIARELEKTGSRVNIEKVTLVRIKKSIDARHRDVKLCLRYKVYIGEEPGSETENLLPVWKKVNPEHSKKVIIIGSGPAGLFGALQLLEYGIKPIIIERGKETSERKRDIASISTAQDLNPNSNYCFGEGGAGTFSDGKIYSRSNKRGNIDKILQIFVHFGADKNILTDAHPHIGTEKLPIIINNIRKEIIALGGEFFFNTKCTDFIFSSNSDATVVNGINAENTITGEKLNFVGDAILLATGHSATDIYKIVAKASSESLEAKTFAMGVRVEHPRDLIDAIQYHGQGGDGKLPTAEYKVTSQAEDRGVYSFCMCPGGFVVPSSTENDAIVVNGMSTSKRNSKWSNAAIVVETRPEDIPERFCKEAKDEGCEAFAGLFFRTWLEKETFTQGKNGKAPAQRLSDFMEGKESLTLPETSYTPGIVSSRLDAWLPSQIANRLKIGFADFNKTMKGYICSDALLIASETRTSTPVRIARSKETYECVGLKHLFPAGEGSGYAGGITSSAMDGENACKAIYSFLLK